MATAGENYYEWDGRLQITVRLQSDTSRKEENMPVKSLLHYALEVPDQTIGEKFYRNFGLTQASARDGAVHLRPQLLGNDSVILYAGAKKRLHHLAFGAPGDNFDRLKESLRRAGVDEVNPPADAPEGGIWIQDPDGNRINLRNQDAERPAADPPLSLNSPGHALRVAARGCPDGDLKSRPRRLGHVLLFSPDLGKQLDFYTRVLGFRLSDRSQNIIVFLRCGTDHHNIALLASTAPGFHHASFEVGSIDELAMGAVGMKESGWQPAWGPGRHVIGSNYFYYIRDPWGSFAEYFHDIDFIPEQCAWEPRDFPEADALYRWGPTPPPDFAVNKEAVL